jgi:hypothetical protein
MEDEDHLRPNIRSISIEAKNKPSKELAKDVSWGQSVELGEVPPNATTVILLSHGGVVRLRQKLLLDNPTKHEAQMQVVGVDSGAGKPSVVNVQWHGEDVHPSVSLQTILLQLALPFMLIITSTYFLGQAGSFDGRMPIWTLIVMLCTQVIVQSDLPRLLKSRRTVKRWTLMLLSWENVTTDVDDNGGAAGKTPSQRAFEASKSYGRFMCSEDTYEECLQRWLETEKWRRDMHVDTIMDRPHYQFDLIKANYPHYFHRRTKNGQALYIERPGGVNFTELAARGITVGDLITHYRYITEFLWKDLQPTEQGKTLTILDVKGIGMRDYGGEVMEFIKGSMSFVQAHYPERSFQIFIINVPMWFNALWKLISPLVNEVTRSKTHIYRSGYESKLLEYVDAESLPSEYGGEDTVPLGESPEEIEMREKVNRVIAKFEAQGYPAPELTDNILDHEAYAKFVAKHDPSNAKQQGGNGSSVGGGGAALESKKAD